MMMMMIQTGDDVVSRFQVVRLLLMLFFAALCRHFVTWLACYHTQLYRPCAIVTSIVSLLIHLTYILTAGLTIRGPHSNVRRIRVARIFSDGTHFFPQNVDDLFLVVLRLSHETCGSWTYVQTSKRRGKNLAIVDRGSPADGGHLPWYNRHNG